MNVELVFHYDQVTFFLLSNALENGNGDKKALNIKHGREFEMPSGLCAPGCSGAPSHMLQNVCARSSVSHCCQVAMRTATAMIRL